MYCTFSSLRLLTDVRTVYTLVYTMSTPFQGQSAGERKARRGRRLTLNPAGYGEGGGEKLRRQAHLVYHASCLREEERFSRSFSPSPKLYQSGRLIIPLVVVHEVGGDGTTGYPAYLLL